MSRLADFPFDMVRIACMKCPRKGQCRNDQPDRPPQPSPECGRGDDRYGR